MNFDSTDTGNSRPDEQTNAINPDAISTHGTTRAAAGSPLHPTDDGNVAAGTAMSATTLPDFPEPSWSTAKQSTYDSCPRQYHFQYYESWQGWHRGSRENNPESRMAYFWSKRRTIATWTGRNIHNAIALCLHGEPQQQVLEHTLRSLQAEWNGSQLRGKVFRKYGAGAVPPKGTLLMEHTEMSLPDEALAEVSARVTECITAFASLGIESQFRQARISGDRYHFVEPPDGIFEPRMVEFAVPGREEPLKVWAMLDCACEVECNRCVVYDWKTGREPSDREESHLTDQLLVHAHYVLGPEGIGSRSADVEIEALEVYLPSCVFYGGPITSGALEDARERISRKAADMLALHNRIREQGERACEPKPAQQACGNCSFRSMCDFAWISEV